MKVFLPHLGTELDIAHALRVLPSLGNCDDVKFGVMMQAASYIERLENKIARMEAVDRLSHKDLPI